MSQSLAPKARRRSPRNTKGDLNHYRRQSLSHKQWWIRDYLNAIRLGEKDCTFGDIVFWLRVINGHTQQDTASALGVPPWGFLLSKQPISKENESQ